MPEGDYSLSNLEATYKMFSMANAKLQQMGKEPQFDVHLVGKDLESQTSNGLFRVAAECTIDDVGQTDLIIIPATHGNYRDIVETNKEFVPWMLKQYRNGAEIASLCIGAFLLASTGLLDQKKCATHWLAAEDFREMFPQVNLVDDKIITDEKGLYTSGGAYSSLNLNLYLIEKYVGREMAVLHSKIFEIDIERDSQSPFIIFKGQKDHQDEAIRSAQEYIEQKFKEKIHVDHLCEMYSIGRRTFERRFKKATNNTVVEYIQRVKVEAAKKELEKGQKTISEVMFSTGYTDTKAFRDVFKKYAGMTPSSYMNRYANITF